MNSDELIYYTLIFYYEYSDSDGIPTFDDNCPTTPNSEQTDTDADGTGMITHIAEREKER